MRPWNATRFSLLPPAAIAIVLVTAALAGSSPPQESLIADITGFEADSGPRQLQEILALGAPAPGFETGATVAAVAEPPRIAGDGSVTFVAWVAMPTGARVQAVYRVTGGRPERVFRGGDPAPGAGDPFRGFPELPQTPRVDDGRLTFVASLESAPGGAPRGGLWSDRFGAFDLLLLQGDTLPGMPAGTGIADFSFTTRREAVLLRAGWTGSGTTSRADQGLWRNRSGGVGGWERVLSRGMAAPGLGSGVVFDGDPTSIFGPLFAFVPRNDGRVLAQAWVRGSGIDANNDEALWLEGSTGLRILVREGAAAPLPSDGRRGDSATFGPTFNTPTFGSDGENATPAVNDFGAVVFGAVVRTRNGRLNTVWTTRSGGLEPLAKGGVKIDGFAPGDQAPGFALGVTFAAFAQSAINNRNEIALRGFTNESGMAADLREALWLDRPGSGLRLVAKKGGAAPGLPGVTFASLEMDTLTDEGAFYYSGNLAGSGVHAGNDRASFRVNPDNTVELLLREGSAVEVVDVSGAAAPRAVAAFTFGPGVTPEGRRVAQVAFQDGRSGLYGVDLPAGGTGGCTPFEVPERSCSDGLDNDCDGRIDTADPDCQPTCLPSRSPCSRDGDCCSQQCRNRSGSRTCR